MKEIWRNIRGYKNIYQISNLGRLRNIHPRSNQRPDGIRKPETDKDGYLVITLHKNAKERSFYIHRLVAKSFIPNPLNLPLINHKNENKKDNRSLNLEWCSYLYNNDYGNRNYKIKQMRHYYVKLTRGSYKKIFPSMNATARFITVSKHFTKSELRIRGLVRQCCYNEISNVYDYKLSLIQKPYYQLSLF